MRIFRFFGYRGLSIERGEGQYVYDSNGKRYLDFHTGHGAAFLGHRPPKVVERLKSQLERVMVTTPSFDSPVLEEALSLLEKVLPKGLEYVFFQNSGTEAVELAMKLTIRATGRKKFVAFKGSFHGRTLGALSLTWNPKYRDGFPSLDVTFADYNDPSLELDELTAAVIVEPVQGEGGVIPSSPEFMRAIRESCDRVGALLIVDEVQSGFGRTGRIWAHEARGISPDILLAGKSVGGGFPVSLVAFTEDISSKVKPYEHGSTHGGNPLALAALAGGVETLLEDEVPAKADRAGRLLMEGINSIGSRLVREVRGEGLMLGVKLRVSPGPIIKAMQEKGLLSLKAGSTTLRFLPPYLITEEDISKALVTLEEVLRDEERRRGLS